MLVKSERLRHAVRLFSARNQLIQELTHLPLFDPNASYKLVLAFWLGANNLTVQFEHLSFQAYVYHIYYCILALDKCCSSLQQDTARI